MTSREAAQVQLDPDHPPHRLHSKVFAHRLLVYEDEAFDLAKCLKARRFPAAALECG
jgi:hypothetical protein